MNNIGWRIHGAGAASFGLIAAAALFACGGDDNGAPIPDSGTTDSSTMDSAKADSPVTTDGTTPDSTGDAPVMTDAGKNDADATSPDADAAPTPLPPLDLCAKLDSDFAFDISQVDTNAPPVTFDDRTVTWGTELVLNTTSLAGPVPQVLPSFTTALTDDCRINNIEKVFTDGGPASANNYVNQLGVFVVQFMGCGQADAGAISFSEMLPVGAASHTFTQADLAVIIDLFVNSVAQQDTIGWYDSVVLPGLTGTSINAGFTVPPTPLSTEQLDDIRTHLQALAAAMPGVNPSTTKLTFSTCDTGDAGAGDAGDAGHDAGDAGHD